MENSHDLFYSLQHIQDAATATQDPNPLHRPGASDQRCDNSVNGPVVLGFQIATLIDSEVSRLDASRALLERRNSAHNGSSYCDIRFLRPARPNEPMRITVKPGAQNAGKQTQACHPETDRFSLRGESGVAASGLRRTSDEKIDLPGALATCELAIDVMQPACASAPNIHYQREQIHGRAGRRFLQASLGSRLVSGQLEENAAALSGVTASIPSCHVPKMYPVALSSKVLARCQPFVDIDLNRRSLMYSRLKLHINDSVSNTLRDGDSLDYLVSSKAAMKSNHEANQGRMIIHVLAYTGDKQLVFWGSYTLSVINAMRRYESLATQRNNRVDRGEVAVRS